MEVQYWYYFTNSWADKEVHAFPKGICPKVNVIERLGFELAYDNVPVQHVNHCAKEIPPKSPC